MKKEEGTIDIDEIFRYDTFRVKGYDSGQDNKKVFDEHVQEDRILLILNDLIYDMVDTGDMIKIEVIKDRDFTRPRGHHEDKLRILWDAREHWTLRDE